MTTVVGHVRQDPIFDIKFVVLSHNTIRSAADGSIYDAELLVQEGVLIHPPSSKVLFGSLAETAKALFNGDIPSSIADFRHLTSGRL